MSSGVKTGKYDFTFTEDYLIEEMKYHLKNIVETSIESDERLLSAKKQLDNQSGEFIDSLNDFLLRYTSINQMFIQDHHRYNMEHILSMTHFIENTYENRSYNLYYHIVELEKK
ncbi:MULTISPECIES: hypothetical protein [Bacillus]|uniref:hypothetical protein n=1 Tax=Bacillus TaxID=1386 RepID=UPI0002EF668D|nr:MULTISPECIES: hypothetical protein [Bacillus]